MNKKKEVVTSYGHENKNSSVLIILCGHLSLMTRVLHASIHNSLLLSASTRLSQTVTRS